MFQYAFAESVAKHCNTKIKLDISLFSEPWVQQHECFMLGIFQNVQTEFATRKEIFQYKRTTLFKSRIMLYLYRKMCQYNVVSEDELSYKPDILKTCKKNSYITGYWQCEKYFENIRYEILNDFMFPELAGQNLEIRGEIENSNSVSIHIRRGDYLKNEDHHVCSLEYYFRAIELIRTKVQNPVFYVFSDDIIWVKENLRINSPIIFVDWNQGKQSFCDMHLMSLCKHNIIANSSFSWWGAWLNENLEKNVVAPQRWCDRRDWETSNLIPETWIKV